MAKFDAQKADLDKDGKLSDYEKNRGQKTAEAMQMSDKVGYTMQHGSRETDSPTTFRADAVMRMGPMLMTHDKPVDTSSYSADTSSAYSKGSFQGSQGENFVTDRNESTSTSTEVIPGEETTNTRLDYKEAWDQNIIEPGQTKGLRDRYEAAGLTFEDYAGGREEQREDDPEGFEADLFAKTKVAGGPGTSTTKTDDQIIETTKTEVDESPRTVQVTQATNRELRKQKKGLKKINKAVDRSAKAYEKQLQKFGLEGLDPTSEKYKRRYNRLSQIEKDKLANRQTDYDDAKTSKRYFSEGMSQNAFYGDQFNTGERETFAQTDFRNQQNEEQNQQSQFQSGTNWKEKFEQDAAKFNSQIRKGLGDLSSLSNLGMPGTNSDSDIIGNIFGTPNFGVKPMQFRAQEGSKASRTGRSKSGGLNRKNNY